MFLRTGLCTTHDNSDNGSTKRTRPQIDIEALTSFCHPDCDPSWPTLQPQATDLQGFMTATQKIERGRNMLPKVASFPGLLHLQFLIACSMRCRRPGNDSDALNSSPSVYLTLTTIAKYGMAGCLMADFFINFFQLTVVHAISAKRQ